MSSKGLTDYTEQRQAMTSPPVSAEQRAVRYSWIQACASLRHPSGSIRRLDVSEWTEWPTHERAYFPPRNESITVTACSGCSSMIQWPESLITALRTSAAAKPTSVASCAP
jgi:hypothetical protein